MGPPCNPPNLPKGAGNKALGRCFVVTAAHGGAATPILDRLRRMRDWLLKSSRLGQRFFELFDEEYYRTSPEISSQMDRNPTLRHAVKAWLVEPLTTFLGILATLVARNRRSTS